MKAFHHIPRPSGKSVYISYLVGESLKEELTNLRSHSVFFFCLYLHLDKRPGEVSLSAKHLCSFTSKQLNKPQN